MYGTQLVCNDCIIKLYIIVYPVTLDDVGTYKMMTGYEMDNADKNP